MLAWNAGVTESERAKRDQDALERLARHGLALTDHDGTEPRLAEPVAYYMRLIGEAGVGIRVRAWDRSRAYLQHSAPVLGVVSQLAETVSG